MEMNPMRSLLAFLILCSVARGQIVVSPAEPKLGELIELSGVPAEATWTLPEGATTLAHEGRWILFPGKGGDIPVEARIPAVFEEVEILVRSKEDPADLSKATFKTIKIQVAPEQVYRETVKVSGGGPPPPPPLPEPKPGSLAALVPGEARVQLAEFYSAWAKSVRLNAKLTTTGQFRADHQEAMAGFQDVLSASGWAAINGPVSAKIAVAVGLQDVALDAVKREALAVALDSIAAEFKGQ